VPQYLHCCQSRALDCGLTDYHLHLLHELTAKGVDDAGHGGSLALADEVEIEHALHGSGLQSAGVLSALYPYPLHSVPSGAAVYSLNETSRLRVEESVLWLRAQRSAGRCEALDVVVGGETAVSAPVHTGRAADTIGAVHGGGSHRCVSEGKGWCRGWRDWLDRCVNCELGFSRERALVCVCACVKTGMCVKKADGTAVGARSAGGIRARNFFLGAEGAIAVQTLTAEGGTYGCRNTAGGSTVGCEV